MRFQNTICLAAGMALLSAACGGPNSGGTRTISESSKDAAFSPMAPVTGAIWTTDPTGTRVNANIYAAKTDVYLNGGPARPGVAGLPDGDYYYQITDPGCKELLAGPEGSGTIPNTSTKLITVVDGETDPQLTQLAPFNDTPNNGGEYKVWVTLVEDYDPDAKNSCFGFIPNQSKTDNFKVRGEGQCVGGTKFFDVDYDGVRDPVDTAPVAGFKIILTYPDDTTAFTYTDSQGDYAFCNLEDGNYSVDEELPPVVNNVTWVQTYPDPGVGYTITVSGADIFGLDFGNSCRINSRWPATPCAVPAY